MLNRLAEAPPSSTVMGLNITPQAKRALEWRVNMYGAMWSLVPKLFLGLLAVALVFLNLPMLCNDVYEVFLDKQGLFTLHNIFIQEPAYYGKVVERLVFCLLAAGIVAKFLLPKKKEGAN